MFVRYPCMLGAKHLNIQYVWRNNQPGCHRNTVKILANPNLVKKFCMMDFYAVLEVMISKELVSIYFVK